MPPRRKNQAEKSNSSQSRKIIPWKSVLVIAGFCYFAAQSVLIHRQSAATQPEQVFSMTADAPRLRAATTDNNFVVAEQLFPVAADAPRSRASVYGDNFTAADARKPKGSLRINGKVYIKQDDALFQNRFRTLVREFLRRESSRCSNADIAPYIEVLKNVDKNASYYEQGEECPLVVLVYFEGSTRLMDTFLNFYRPIEKRCVQFMCPRRDIKGVDADRLRREGYTIINTNSVKQDKVTNLALGRLRETYGNATIVTVNDLDHQLAWHLDGEFYRYATYSDMVTVYTLDLITTGCAEQQVAEKFVVPCTCMIENNEKYVPNDRVIYSQYGTHNMFHPTGSFYLHSMPEGIIGPDWAMGTVYSNLYPPISAICHHKMGKSTTSDANHAAVIHLRSGSELHDLLKYMTFLKKNGWGSSETIRDVMICAMGKPSDVLLNLKKCRKVKEISNIVSILHQKQLCLSAGYSEDHCRRDSDCCITTSQP